MTRLPYWLMLGLALLVALSLAPGASVTRTQAQSTTASLIRQFDVPGFSDSKYPDVLGVGKRVYVAGSPGSGSTRDATYTYSDQPFETFAGNTQVGAIKGQSDYSPTVLAAGPDGSVYIMWDSVNDKKLFIKRRGPSDTGFGATSLVQDSSGSKGSFPSRLDLAVLSTGRVFAIWDDLAKIRYRYSDDNGATWSGTGVASGSDTPGSRGMIAAGPNGSLYITYSTAGNSGAGEIKVAAWNGSSFNTAVNLTGDLSGYAGDPTVAVGPDGRAYVAWRIVEGGIYYAERDPSNGNWNRSRLVGGKATAYGSVAIVSDREGNLHLSWGGDTSGKFDFWYAYKPFGQAWQGPIQATNDSDLDANLSISQTIDDFSYGHVVGERFTSVGLRTRYAVFKGLAGGCQGTLALTAPVTIDGKKFTTSGTLTGTITPSSGCTPALMQITANTPPTDKSTPAQVAYNASVSVAAPPSLVGTQCEFTVYGHLYKDAAATFSAASIFSDKINIDPTGDVDATVKAINPNISGISSTFTPFSGDAGTALGAAGGDPAWTRNLTYYLSIQNANDCSGLKAFSVAGGASTNLTNQAFGGVLAIPTAASTAPGLKSFDVSVTDTIGNLKTFTQSITYDPLEDPTLTTPNSAGRPLVVAATMANDNSSATARKSILRTLSFSGVNVTDNLYPAQNGVGTQFWGVWVANGPRNNLNPDPTTLLWVPVKVTSPASSFSIPWNVFNNGAGPRLDQDGQYVVFVKFLDGAGNPSTTTVSTTLTLDPGYSLPTNWLPSVAKP